VKPHEPHEYGDIHAPTSAPAGAGAWHQRVQHDQPNREVVHGVLNIVRVGNDAGQVLQRLAQVVAPVMVAGNDKHRHRLELAQQAVQMGIFGVQAALGQIAGDQHHVGA